MTASIPAYAAASTHPLCVPTVVLLLAPYSPCAHQNMLREYVDPDIPETRALKGAHASVCAGATGQLSFHSAAFCFLSAEVVAALCVQLPAVNQAHSVRVTSTALVAPLAS